MNKVWTSRPQTSQAQVFIHELQYSGASVSEKLEKVLKESKTSLLFTSVLDDIA